MMNYVCILHQYLHLHAGADSEGVPGGPLSDYTTIIKFSGSVLKYFLHSFSIV